VDELRFLLDSIGMSPRDILSTRSKAYQQRRDDIDGMSDDELLAAMVEEPTLIRRPIVVSGDEHVVGSRKADLERLAERSA
jgi:arsenate reductase (glutaredoxin)